MILKGLEVDVADFARRTGWQVKPEGACKDLRCVPLPAGARREDRLSIRLVAERLGMPLVADQAHGLWALGPEAGGRVLKDAAAPDLVLPDWRGAEFRLEGLRGLKVLLVCWASW
ncbi:MAG TPA: hypothetical protein VGR61_06425 [Candidatus Dormibacteraeota bacterium]|nr:hypothetical protein [Candidatus Dormibacteraeota bacterium]